MTKRVQSVVVVGRDAPAWLVACALQRSLGATGLRVQVIELPSQQSSVDVYSAVPALGALHRLLGLEESARSAHVPGHADGRPTLLQLEQIGAALLYLV